jgi:hypothetical protein
MPSVRTVVRTLIAAFLIATPLLAAFEAPAAARVDTASFRTDQVASRSLTLSVDSMSPNFAQPNSTITVSGTFTNNTGSPIQGFQVELWTSDAPFITPSGMTGYTSGGVAPGVMSQPPNETVFTPTRILHTGTSVHWTASFTAADAGYTLNGLNGFGVYPVEAVAVSTSPATAGNTLAASRTLLPYWPGSGAADPVNVAWVWPLIDKPQQGACQGILATNSLAASMSPGGRLNGLLTAGLRWKSQLDLTWAVDPALLSDAQAMTVPYKVGGNSKCTDTKPMPASAAAGHWLDTLRTGTAGEPVFVTPYADVDVSALAHAGLEPDIQSAYTLGEKIASESLDRPFGEKGTGTGDGVAPSIAWPADGTADAGVLTALANAGGVSTVMLNDNEMPNAASDVTSAQSGIGTTMRVLLTNSTLTGVLGSASAGSSAGAQFAAEQDYFAQTAMFVAKAPNTAGRSVIVAPPRRWDPSPAEANTLLSLTAKAPWLRPTGLPALAKSKASPPQALSGIQVSGKELTGSYLNHVKSTSTDLAMYEDLVVHPDKQALAAAMAATESSAWRGSGSAYGLLTIGKLANFLTDAKNQVQIIAGKKVLLAGASGDTPVSVQNSLDVPVQVRVVPSVPEGSELSFGNFVSLVTVPAKKTSTVKVPIRSSGIDTTTMQLQLVTKNGSPLTGPTYLTVEVTRYGRALLILIGGALGVLVLTSVARWIRQWLNDTRAGSGGTG